MRKYLLAFILCFFFFNSYTQNAESIYKNTVNSTVTIETEDKLGSGFFIGNNIIVTNYHVIKGSLKAYCYTTKSSTKYKIEGFIAFDKSNDLILLKVSGLNRISLKFSTTSIITGQNVYVIGSPKGLPATISNGIVSGLRKFNSNDLIQITAPISPGSSGGPVLNSKGQLIGVSVSQLTEGQNLNFAIPAKHLKELISNISSVKELMYLDEELVSEIKATFSFVKIGTSSWMTTNLNVSRFQNGDIIPEAKSNEEWEQAGKEGRPAWSYYNNDPANGEKYGKLYNWYAVVDSRILAPRGWHIATINDWENLITELGEENVGSAIKSSTEWEQSNGINSSGFTAYPSGGRWIEQKFRNFGVAAFWWTTKEIDNNLAFSWLLTMNSNEILSKQGNKIWGMSVRCVKD